MSKLKMFGSGIPTGPDVEKLVAAFAVPQEGVLIPYADVSAAISEPHNSSRYNSVTMAWRKRLWREHNVRVGTDPGKGFVALDPSKRISQAWGRQKSALRITMRSAELAQRTDPARLTAEDGKARDHLIRVGAVIRLAAATEAKALKYE